MSLYQKSIVNVAVATVWTTHESARAIDEDAISNPVQIDSWLSKLNYETRLELCHANLVQSQVLLGQEVIVTGETEGWSNIIVPEQPSGKNDRGYPGWIPTNQLARSVDWNMEQGPVATVISRKAMLYSEAGAPIVQVSYQTILPVIAERENKVFVQLPEGSGFLKEEDVTVSSAWDNRLKGSGKDIIAEGERFLGLPYLWGGMSSFGFDCSGFSYMLCRAIGYKIPRDAGDQASSGKQIELDAILPGDLLFFAYEEGKGSIHHVGIYYGDGKLLHSPKTGKTIEIIDIKGTIYEKELCTASRYWQETGE